MSASKRIFTYLSLALFLSLFLMAGCTKNTVPLSYKPAQKLTTPPCENSVLISSFKDNRSKASIGSKANGEKFYPDGDVSQWVAFALFEEMQNADCNVYLKDKSATQDTDYVVTGSIENINLKQLSSLKFTNTIKLRVKMLKDDELVYHESFIGYIKKNVIMPANTPEKIMATGLQDLMKEITFKVIGTMK